MQHLKAADLVSSHRPGLCRAGAWNAGRWGSWEIFTAELEGPVPVAALGHGAFWSVCSTSSLFCRAGKSLQCLALQEVAPRPSEMTFYMKLVDIHVLKTMELKNAEKPTNLSSLVKSHLILRFLILTFKRPSSKLSLWFSWDAWYFIPGKKQRMKILFC